MASNIDFVQYVCDQISGAGEITHKKMFGEYGIYCNGKVIGVICDNQFFVKKTSAGAAILVGCEEAAPYTGAKPHLLIESVDDKDLMSKFISATYDRFLLRKAKRNYHQRKNRNRCYENQNDGGSFEMIISMPLFPFAKAGTAFQ